MLSEPLLETLSHFISLNSRLYSIPSSWNSSKRQFQRATGAHRRKDAILSFIEILFRIWINVAYGYMLYRNLQDPTTRVRALLPLAYLCSMNWTGIVRYASHAYRMENEEFVNKFIRLNAYLGKIELIRSSR